VNFVKESKEQKRVKKKRKEQLAVEVDRLNDKMHIPTKQTDVPLGYLRKVQHIHFWKHHSMIT
jgi:hypothetical protein